MYETRTVERDRIYLTRNAAKPHQGDQPLAKTTSKEDLASHALNLYILVYCSHAHPQLGTTTMQTTYSVNIFSFSTLYVCTTITFQQIRDLCVLDQGDLSFFIFFHDQTKVLYINQPNTRSFNHFCI